MVPADGRRVDLHFAAGRTADARTPGQDLGRVVLTVYPDQFSGAFNRSGRGTDAAIGGPQPLDASLDPPENVRIVAFAAFQAPNKEFALLQSTTCALQGPTQR